MKPVRLVESLIPGLGHLRRGYLAGSWRFLLYFAVWSAIVIGRWPAIVEAASRHAMEDLVALGFLVLMPVALVAWAHSSLKRWTSPQLGRTLGMWALAARAFRRHPRGVWGLTVLGFIYMVALLCPVLAPYDPYLTPRDTIVNKYLPPLATIYVFGDTSRGEVYGIDYWAEGDDLVVDRGESLAVSTRKISPSQFGEPRLGWSRSSRHVRTMSLGGREIPYRVDFHLLGTDSNGRDLLSRIIYGSRVSLTIGFAAVAVAVTLGIVFGGVAGYVGGLVDGLIMRFVEILLAFPRLLLLLLIITISEGAGIFVIVVVLGATGWMGVARLVRAEFLKLKQLDFATAARAYGASGARIMFRHLMPNALAPVIVAATLRVGDTILVEAALSFLGMGVKPPAPTWGNIVNDGSDALANAWWISTLAGLAIVVTVVSFNLVGDALRDALDPRQATEAA